MIVNKKIKAGLILSIAFLALISGMFLMFEKPKITSYAVMDEKEIGLNSESSLPSEWRMFGRFLNHARYNPVDAPANLAVGVDWVDIGDGVRSSPAVANGVVYVGGVDGSIYALNASNIRQQIDKNKINSAIYSSPAVANGVVYIASWDGVVYALNASNINQELGRYETGSFIVSSPVVADGILYIGCLDGNIYALDASNINQKIGSYETGSFIESSPAVANGVVYVGGLDGNVYALDAFDITKQVGNYTTGGFVASSPAVANGVVYVGSSDGKLYALSASDISKKLGEFKTEGEILSSPAVANGVVYVGSFDNKIYALNAQDISQMIGSFNTKGKIYSSPAVANGVVYVGSFDGNVYALNSQNISQQLGRYLTGNLVLSSPAIVDGAVYIGSEDGRLYTFRLRCTDSDRDGYYVEESGCGTKDCNDTNAAVNPNATEICNSIDDNCNGIVDEGCGIKAPAEKLTPSEVKEIQETIRIDLTPKIETAQLEENKLFLVLENKGNKTIKNIEITVDKPEKDELVVMHPFKVFGWDMGKLIGLYAVDIVKDSRLLEWHIEGEMYKEELKPGEKIESTFDVKTPLTKKKKVNLHLKVKSYGELVFEKIVEVEINETKLVLATDAKKEDSIFDIYMVIANMKERDVNFNVELSFNEIPADIDVPAVDAFRILARRLKTIFIEYYGPYKVKALDAVLLAYEYRYDERFAKDYLVRAVLFENDKKISEAESRLDLKK